MGPHDAATIGLGQFTRMQRLGHGTDLVHFEQEAVAGLLTDSLFNSLRVGDCEIIPNHLDAGTSCGLLAGFSVFLVKGVLHGHHWIFPDEGFMQVRHLVGCYLLESSGDLKSRSYLLDQKNSEATMPMQMKTWSD